MPNHHHSIHHSICHSIHLGAAWEPPAPAEADGHLLWTRRFGRPGGLQADDQVLLVVLQPTVAADVVLNGVRLPPLSAGAGHWSQDVTPLLRERNELLLTVAASANDGVTHGQRGRGLLPSVIGTVALEIMTSDVAADRSSEA